MKTQHIIKIGNYLRVFFEAYVDWVFYINLYSATYIHVGEIKLTFKYLFDQLQNKNKIRIKHTESIGPDIKELLVYINPITLNIEFVVIEKNDIIVEKININNLLSNIKMIENWQKYQLENL